MREFGSTAFRLGQPLELRQIGGESRRRGRGPNSKAFKFSKTLCQRCNDTRSQPFDRAYDEFMAYIDREDRALVRVGAVDLRMVWRDAWREKALDLFRYYTKHLACRIVEELSLRVDEEILGFLDGGSPPAFLSFDFTLFGDMAGVIAAYERVMGERFGHVGLGPLWGHPTDEGDGWVGIEGALTTRWLRLHWYYGETIGPFGDPARSGVIQLHDPHSLVGEQRMRRTLTATMSAAKLYERATGRQLFADLERVPLIGRRLNPNRNLFS